MSRWVLRCNPSKNVRYPQVTVFLVRKLPEELYRVIIDTMDAINIKNIPVGLFTSVWTDIFIDKKNDCLRLYEATKCFLEPSKRKDAERSMAANYPFTFIWNRFCWENMFITVYFLNGESLDGRFKILTNNDNEEYHFVIYDSEANVIYDPTYEKTSDSELIDGSVCKGTECTKEMLGEHCFVLSLDFFLREFELQNSSFNSQLREYGGRFLQAVS